MTYQVAYNPALGNALVGVASHFDTVPDGLLVETIEGDIPDLTKCVWSEGALRFDLVSNTRELTKREWRLLFTAVVREAEWLAAEADSWASHAVMLQQAWPKLTSAETPLVK